MSQNGSLAFVLVVVVACGGATQQQQPRADEDAVAAGQAGATQQAAGGRKGASGGRGAVAAGAANSAGFGGSGGSASSAGRDAGGPGGVPGSDAGTSGVHEPEGGAGSEEPPQIKPWEPRVPPGVLPLEGEDGLTGIWYGAVELEAPGWWAPPIDHLTVALDESGLRSFVFQQFSRSGMVTGAAITAPALENGRVFPVDASASSATAFDLGYTARVESEGVDYVESVKGELQGDQLAVEYSISGALSNASSIEGRAFGLLHRVGAVRAPYTALPGIWYGLVALSAPGFVGPPEDQLSISFDAQGRLRHLRFEVFSLFPLTFGDSEGDFPLSGARQVRPRETTSSYDAEVQQSSFTASTFALALEIRNHDDTTAMTDVAVSITGTLGEQGLDVSYSMVGIIYTASVDAHAEGLLLP
ncbi:MAG TPA: hypothetical protein VEX18_04535 [Polyangiaceae bacterium]|nr:hypothetical protein [Polyangiaceae bacterium]